MKGKEGNNGCALGDDHVFEEEEECVSVAMSTNDYVSE